MPTVSTPAVQTSTVAVVVAPNPNFVGGFTIEGAAGTAGQILTSAGAGAAPTWEDAPSPGGAGTVTSVSVTTANGVSGSVATDTTTPAITLTLGDIAPTGFSAPTFTLATLPSVSPAGRCIYVSDATGGSLTGSLCFSNGTVFVDVTTGAAVA